jgi:hypothetical protein
MRCPVNPLLLSLSLALSTVASSPREDVAAESVDLIEVNHFYDDQGRLVFDQLLFYDWSHSDGRYQLRAWRMVKNNSQLPQRNWQSGGYSSVWQDGDVLRKVVAPATRESWTQYDPELTEREYLPKERRRELRSPSTLVKAKTK